MVRAAIGREWIAAGYHRFYLTPDGEVPLHPSPAPVNELVAGRDGVVEVVTGIHSGGVHVTVESWREPPPLAAGAEEWEDMGEASVIAAEGRLRVTAGIMQYETYDDLPNLCAAGPGSYRIRVAARERKRDYDGTVRRSHEFYLLQVWPAPPEQASSLRGGPPHPPKLDPETMSSGPRPPATPQTNPHGPKPLPGAPSANA